MKLILLLIIVILLGVLVSLVTKKEQKQMVIRVVRPMWWAPAGRKPPNHPSRWGYRRLCRKRLNC